MTVLEKIEYLMSINGLNKRQLSVQSRVPYSTISNLWARGSVNMSLSLFRALCDFFGVTMDSMAYDDREIVYRKDVKMPEITPAEKDIIHAFRYLDDDGKGRILNALNYERTQEKERKKVSEAS